MSFEYLYPVYDVIHRFGDLRVSIIWSKIEEIGSKPEVVTFCTWNKSYCHVCIIECPSTCKRIPTMPNKWPKGAVSKFQKGQNSNIC